MTCKGEGEGERERESEREQISLGVALTPAGRTDGRQRRGEKEKPLETVGHRSSVYNNKHTLKTVVGGTMYTKWVNTHSLTKYEGLCEFVVKQYVQYIPGVEVCLCCRLLLSTLPDPQLVSGGTVSPPL